MFDTSLILRSSSSSLDPFVISSCSSSTATQRNTRHRGIMNTSLKYDNAANDTSKTVKYIKFFIDSILTNNDSKSRGE